MNNTNELVECSHEPRENQISEAEAKAFNVDCEKCGEETGNSLIGDESYSYCRECNWVTH